MDNVLLTILALTGVVIFLAPALIAFNRTAPNRYLVLVINLFFGATFIGWVIALALALRSPRARF
ncbi:superinfection immunity protein [Streptomyces sp. NPDC005963]|uniref:superinfection immunity protein n=1 Tax=Streptomyces sp. NPDC005963 TaxID=3156721 RepID=UPI00340B4940